MVEWVNGVGSGRGYSISDQRGSFPPDKEEERGGGGLQSTTTPAGREDRRHRGAEDSASFMEPNSKPPFAFLRLRFYLYA